MVNIFILDVLIARQGLKLIILSLKVSYRAHLLEEQGLGGLARRALSALRAVRAQAGRLRVKHTRPPGSGALVTPPKGWALYRDA